MKILFGILALFIHSSQCQISFIFTSSWYISSSVVDQIKSQTIDIYACLPKSGFRTVYISNGLSLLSPIPSLTAESTRLLSLNLTFAIGERNSFLDFIYPVERLSLIGPMYPSDNELMDVVMNVFKRISGNSPNISVMVIINRTQDTNNLNINNYENIVSYINRQNWTNVKFISYVSVEDIIYNLRKQSNFIVISLLQDPEVNRNLVQKTFLAHLMVWKYRWLGGTNFLNSTEFGLGVITNNVTIITFSLNGGDGRQILIQTAFNVTNNVLSGCSSRLPTLTGDFTGSTRNTFTYFVYKNPGYYRQQLGFVTYDVRNQSISTNIPVGTNIQLTEEISANLVKTSGFRVGFIEYPPFSMMNGTTYTGFVVELLNDVLRDFNVTPIYTPTTMNQIGRYYHANLSYTGFLELVQYGIFDTVTLPAILTIDRLNNFDFVTNILDGSIVAMYKNVSYTGIYSLQYYFVPLDYRVWITLICSAFAIALALALTDFLYPDKFARYKLLMSIFFSISSLTHGAYFDPPRRAAGRIIMCFWWLFCLFIVVIWATNYTALLAKQITEEKLSSIFSLLRQNDKNYTTVSDSVVLPYLISNPQQDPQLLYRIMIEEIVNGTLRNFRDAADLISNKSYVIIGDDKSMADYRYKNCLASFGKYLSFNYGLALPRYSGKTLSIQNKIATRAAQGKIAALITKYFPNYNPDCTSKSIIDIISAWLQNLVKTRWKVGFDVKEMISVFVIIIVGNFVTLILAFVERLIRLVIMKSQERQNMYKYETTVEQLTQF